jgi:hypothetical protein
MRWWRRRSHDQAEKALEEAQKERKAAEDRRHETRSIARQLREIRDANHFAENIRRALGDN